MATGRKSFPPILIALFLLVTFGTGLLLITATQQNADIRSRASYGDVGETCLSGAPASNPQSCRNCKYGIVGPGMEAEDAPIRECAPKPIIESGQRCSFAEEGLPYSCANCRYGWPSGVNANNPEGTCGSKPIGQQASDIFNAIQQAAAQGLRVISGNQIGTGDTTICDEGETPVERRLPNGDKYMYCDPGNADACTEVNAAGECI